MENNMQSAGPEKKAGRSRAIISVVAVIIIVILGWAAYRESVKRHGAAVGGLPGSLSATSTAGAQAGTPGVVTTPGSGHITVTPVGAGDATSTALANAGALPDLSHKTAFASTTQPDVVTFLSGKIAALQSSLKGDPSQFAPWINLGLEYQAAGDYRAAADAWTYVGKLYPSDYISFGNLGDLYAYYLKNNAMAEISFLAAIKNGPTQINLYFQLEDLYYNIMKDPAKAKAIVEQGLKANPGNKPLTDLLATIK